MVRLPNPSRTKRGTGAAAKLALTLDYYRAADAIGPDWGALYGRDDEGPWELKFEGDEERQRVLEQVFGRLRDVATEARDESDARAPGMTAWLKAVGAQ